MPSLIPVPYSTFPKTIITTHSMKLYSITPSHHCSAPKLPLLSYFLFQSTYILFLNSNKNTQIFKFLNIFTYIHSYLIYLLISLSTTPHINHRTFQNFFSYLLLFIIQIITPNILISFHFQIKFHSTHITLYLYI